MNIDNETGKIQIKFADLYPGQIFYDHVGNEMMKLGAEFWNDKEKINSVYLKTVEPDLVGEGDFIYPSMKVLLKGDHINPKLMKGV